MELIFVRLPHTEGLTAATVDVRDTDQFEEILEQAEAPIEPRTVSRLTDPIVLAVGDGWAVVAPADRLVKNRVMKWADADRRDDEILGLAPSWIDDPEKYDFVEVDAEPVPASDRRPD